MTTPSMTRAQRLYDALTHFGPMDARQAAQVTHDNRAQCSSTLSDLRLRGITVAAGFRRYPDAKQPLVRYALAPGATRPLASRQAPRVPVVTAPLQRAPEPVPVHAKREPIRYVQIGRETLAVMWDGAR